MIGKVVNGIPEASPIVILLLFLSTFLEQIPELGGWKVAN